MAQRGNPQGKGLVPVLQGLQQYWHQPTVVPKRIEQVSLELFTSLFVLQSEIRFTPVRGQSYWLYRRPEQWCLSLVAPQEWGSRPPGRFIGRCQLRDDLTWTLELDGLITEDADFMAAVACQQAALQERLEQAVTLEQALPAYVEDLGYHGRLLAAMLGRSLRHSMQLSGIAALNFEAAKGLLAGDKLDRN